MKPLDRDTYPIDLRLFAHGNGIWGQVNTMSQYGLFKLEDLLNSEDPNGPEPWLPIDAQVIEQIDFNNQRSLRFLRILLIDKDGGRRKIKRKHYRRLRALGKLFRGRKSRQKFDDSNSQEKNRRPQSRASLLFPASCTTGRGQQNLQKRGPLLVLPNRVDVP